MVELGEKQSSLNREFGRQIAKVADYTILVGKNQTIPIQEGIREENYDEDEISFYLEKNGDKWEIPELEEKIKSLQEIIKSLQEIEF